MLCYIKSELNYKKSKRWHLNVANSYGGNSIQSITQILELFEAAEENYRDDAAV